MSKSKILIADEIASEGIARLAEQSDFEVINTPGLDRTGLAAAIADCDAVIVRSATKITADVIALAPRLRAIGRAGIGVDNIDVPAATARGIVVFNTPDANATTTAELALTHMFALSRNLSLADRSVREGQWLRSKFLGSEVAGKTLGVVGFGTIGRIMAARGLGLAMRVIAYDPFVTAETMRGVGVEARDLDLLLTEADYVTIHCPLTPKTRNLINAERLAMLKPTARLINCARGGLVDEQALYEVLKANRIAGAALDVFVQEPPADSPLLTLPNVSLTPHLGASTAEAQRAAGIAIAAQMAAFLCTGEAISAVNLPRIAPELIHRLEPYQELALALGRLLAVLAVGPLDQMEIRLAGKIAELDGRPIVTAALVGFLREQLAVPVNEVNAAVLAAERGVRLVEAKTQDASDYVSSLIVTGTSGGKSTVLIGTLLAERLPRLVQIDDYRIEASLQGHMIVTQHQDQPGVVGNLGNSLGMANINISRMQVGTHLASNGTAMAILNVDRALTAQEFEQLQGVSGVNSVYQIGFL